MTQTTPTPTPSGAFWQRCRELDTLRRPSDHRAIAGVAEGLSRHFDVDPIIVRVLFAALTFFSGAGLILYVALWLTVPQEETGGSVVSGLLHRDARAWTTIGLAAGGIFAALAFLGSLSWALPHPFPFLLIAFVVVLAILALTRRADRSSPGSRPGAGTSARPSSGGTAGPGSASSVPTDPRSAEASTALISPPSGSVEAYSRPAAAAPSTIVMPYAVGGPTPTGEETTTVPTGSPVPPFPVPPPRASRPRSHLFGLTLAVVALAEAGIWIIDAATSYDVHPSVYPGAALAIIALALLVGTWWGRSRGLIAVGLVAGLLTAAAAFAGPGPYGDRVAMPRTSAALQSSYTMGIGQFTLHLEQIRDIESLDGRVITVKQRIGELRVIVPSSVAAVVTARADHGSVVGPRHVEDIGEGGERAVLTPAADGRPTITLHLNVVYGEVRIERAPCPDAPRPGRDESTTLWMGDSYAAAACN